MPVVVALVSQKGGVGKSTISRGLAALASHAKLKVRVADLDVQQPTVSRWGEARRDNAIKPSLDVKAYFSIDEVVSEANDVELVIIDAPGRTDRGTLAIAKHAHLIVQPTGPSRDDLYPGVLLFHEMTRAGIPNGRMVFALCRTHSKEEEKAARSYIGAAGYAVLDGALPERPQYRAAQNDGRAITETDRADLNARADALMLELLQRVLLEIQSLQVGKKTRRTRA